MDPHYYNRLTMSSFYTSISLASVSNGTDRRSTPIHDVGDIQARLSNEASESAVSGDEATMVKREARLDRIYESLYQSPRPARCENLLKYKQATRMPRTILEERKYQEDQEEKLRKQLEACSISNRYECYKTLDAPGLSTDFYTNVMHISAKDTMAIALADKMYLLPLRDQKEGLNPTVLQLGNGESMISCAHWIAKTNMLFTGFGTGHFTYCDAESNRSARIRQLSESGITCATSGSDNGIVYAGNKCENGVEGSIAKIDLRARRVVGRIRDNDHICSLALAEDGLQLAVGTNANEVKIFDLRNQSQPYQEFQCFEAAVKALSWFPWKKDVLMAGGGTADRRLKALSVVSGRELASVDTDSQITAIHAIAQENRFISCHGYNGDVSVVWKYDNNAFRALSKLEGHSGRILHSALNADKTELFTASEDETLKFWKSGITVKKVEKKQQNPFPHNYHTQIR